MKAAKISAVILALLCGCEADVRIKGDGFSDVAKVAEGESAWFTGKLRMTVADQTGQVYELRQMWSNANAYTVYLIMGETNGLTRKRAAAAEAVNTNGMVRVWFIESDLQPSTINPQPSKP